MTYDIKCFALAQDFLLDERLGAALTAKAADELAQEIQKVIEDFIGFRLPTLRDGPSAEDVRAERDNDAMDFAAGK